MYGRLLSAVYFIRMNLFRHKKYLLLLFIFLGGKLMVLSQNDVRPLGGKTFQNPTASPINSIRNPNTPKAADSLEKRNRYEDSITIRYRYADRIGTYTLDSSVNDFNKHFPLKADDVYLGNLGTASRSIIFSPLMDPGWDHGFHSFDRYMKRVEDARYFTTTRPYTELGYIIANRSEQTINLVHTQNIKPNWNIAGEYQLLSSPGFYQNQKSQNSAYMLNSYYQGKKKRYAAYFAMVGNRINVFESGGIQSDTFLTSKTTRFLFDIPTNIGGASQYQTSFFGNSAITTGDQYKNFHVMFRQQYDLGQRDSLMPNDSTTIYLFYPRLRLQYQVDYSTYDFKFNEENRKADSAFFQDKYGLTLLDSLFLRDKWMSFQNDFSVYQFPYAKNPNQYIKVGAALQTLHATFFADDTTRANYHNVILHGEYRNRTRNKKWDINAAGHFYLNGLNTGDYDASLSLRRVISQKFGYFELAFHNVNKSPSFIYETASSFSIGNTSNFKKENISQLYAGFSLPELKLKLEGNYYIVTNYLYLTNFKERQQNSGLFNVLTVNAEKQFRLSKKWNWYTQVVVQKTLGNAPLNVPLVWTRNRIAFEGVYYKNLNISTGIEVRYHTSYKADNYSPLLGQFFYQESETISNLPDITAFLHFRIKSFNGFLRAENLNSARYANGDFSWNNVNTAAPSYHYPGFLLRVGIHWWFVN